jgi:hypothetical protein
MNEFLASIYGTGGAEKVASYQDPTEPATLHDLALALVYQELGEDAELDKLASLHDAVQEKLIEFDRAGRAVAHAEFSELEKAAFEDGDWGPLSAFFDDEEELQEQIEEPQYTPVQLAVLNEINRRANAR